MRKNIEFIFKICVLFFMLYGMYQFFGTNLFIKPSSKLNIENYYIQLDEKTTELTLEQKIADYDYFCAYMQENYPLFKIEERQIGTNFLEHKLDYREKIKNTKNDYEFFVVMNEMFEFFISPHTYLISPKGDGYNSHDALNSDSIKKNNFLMDQDNYWSNYLDKEITNYLSDKTYDFRYEENKYIGNINNETVTLLEIDNQPPEEYIKSIHSIYKYRKKGNLYYRNRLIFNNQIGDEVEISYVSESNEIISQMVKISSYHDFALLKMSYNEYEKNNNRKEDYLTYIDQKKSVFYIKINNFANDSGFDIKKELLEGKKKYKNIIIDIQNNPGGTINYSKRFILPAIINKNISGKYEYYMLFTNVHNKILKEEYLTNEDLSFKKIEDLNNRKLLKNKLGYKIKALELLKEEDVNIHLIVNENTTSSADYFARICKDNNIATLYGEMAGGEGILNSYALFYLPNSGLVISYNPFYGYNPDGTNNTEFGTLPDKEIDLANKTPQEIIDLIFRDLRY